MKFLKSAAQFLLITVGVAIAFAAGFVILNGQFFYETYHGRGEIAEKHDWSLLQTAEWKNPDKAHTDEMPFVFSYVDRYKEEYIIIGLPKANSSKGYVWTLAQPTSFPKVKLLPKDTPFKLTKDGLLNILSETKLDPEVEAFLKQHVSE